MTRRLIIHAGTDKTGSTSIQEFLLTNRKTLTSHGFAYPLSGNALNRKQIAERTGNARYIGDFVTGQPTVTKAQFDKILSQTLSGHSKQHVVMSSELIYQGTTERLTQLSDAARHAGFSPHIIICVRPVTDYLTSLFRHKTRYHGLKCTIAEYIDAKNIHAAAGLDRLTKIFGPEALSILPYTPHPADNITAFLKAANIPLQADPATAPHANRSLDAYETAMLGYLNTQETPVEIVQRIGRDLTSLSANPSANAEQIITLTPEKRSGLQKEADTINSYLPSDQQLPPVAAELSVNIMSIDDLTCEDKKLLQIIASTYEANLALKGKSDLIRLWRVLRSDGTLREKLARLKAIYAN